MADENADLTPDSDAPQSRGTGWIVLCVLLLLGIGATWAATTTNTPTTIRLTAAEAKQAQTIAEKRQQLEFDRAEATNNYNAQMNRLGERGSAIAVEAEKLCFAMKKAHALAPQERYVLDEWRGVLKKQ